MAERSILNLEVNGTLDLAGVTNKATVLSDLGAGVSAIATDSLWDAAGDLVVGTGSNTAARLAKGAALQILRVNAAGTALEYAAAAATITGADTQVLFFDGANTPAGDAGMTYNKTSDTLTVTNATLAGTLTALDLNATTLDVTGALIVTGANAEVSFTPTGANTVTINPTTVGAINRMNIGATTRGTGAFTTLSLTTPLAFTSGGTGLATLGTALQVLRTNAGATALEWAEPAAAAAGSLTGSTLAAGVTASSLLSAAGGTFGTAAFTPATNYVTPTTLNNSTLPAAFTTLSASGLMTLANVILGGPAAATLQLGTDAATGVNQKIQAMAASAGTGGNLTLAAGTGTTAGGALIFQTAATGTLTNRLTITAEGQANFTGAVDSLSTIGNQTLGTFITSSGNLSLRSFGFILPQSDGVWALQNNGLSGFDRLQLGGTTSSFPSLKRRTTTLEARLADDSLITTLIGAMVLKAGAVSDADFTNPVDGCHGYDTTNFKHYIRSGGTWKSSAAYT